MERVPAPQKPGRPFRVARSALHASPSTAGPRRVPMRTRGAPALRPARSIRWAPQA